MYDTENCKQTDFDEYTGYVLPEGPVRAAIMEELGYVSEKVIWAAADYGEMNSDSTSTFVRMRWVLCNKGDEVSPDVRARLVACEIARDKQSQFYESDPRHAELMV